MRRPYQAPTYFSRDFRPMHMYAKPAYGDLVASDGSPSPKAKKWARNLGIVAMLGHPLAMALSYKRNEQLTGGKRLTKAFFTGFIWLPYLIYVAIDK